jgi:hypothetical protein
MGADEFPTSHFPLPSVIAETSSNRVAVPLWTMKSVEDALKPDGSSDGVLEDALLDMTIKITNEFDVARRPYDVNKGAPNAGMAAKARRKRHVERMIKSKKGC